MEDELIDLDADVNDVLPFRVRNPRFLHDLVPRPPEGLGTLYGHNGGNNGVWADMFFRPSNGAGAIVLANGDALPGGGSGARPDPEPPDQSGPQPLNRGVQPEMDFSMFLAMTTRWIWLVPS